MCITCLNPCELYNTYEPPYQGKKPKYLFVGDSVKSAMNLIIPNKSDFWKLMADNNFTKDQFKIVYSLNCFIDGKPSEHHRDLCRPNIEKVIKSFNPKFVIISGNFALHTLTNKWGITKYENKCERRVIFGKEYDVMYWQSVNTMFFNNKIEKSIKKFKCYI